MMTVAALHLPFLAALGVMTGESLAHVAAEVAAVAILLGGALVLRRRVSRAVMVSLSLVACSALLVHLTGGLIESHFHFFVMLPLISLYRDWRPLMVGLVFVLAHHSVAGLLAPESVYNHDAAIANPVRWAVIHATYVLGLTTVILAYWRFSENLERDLAREEDRRAMAEAEQHRMEAERLEHLVKAKDEFVASISHELRTPLAAVLGFSELLRESSNGLSEEERAELSGTIAQEAHDLAGIVEDLLVAARTELKTIHISQVPVDLRANASQVIEVLPEQWGQRVEIMGDSVRAMADPVRVRQVVRNLVSNAIRYGGPTVKVSVSSHNGRAQLSVSDDGPGIPTEQREQAFAPYHSAHDPGTQPSSVGLGLSVSRQLAELMGGRLEYAYEDGLSTFRLSLPTVTEEAVSSDPIPVGSSLPRSH